MSNRAYCPECGIKFTPGKCEVKKTKDGIALHCPNCEDKITCIDWQELLDNGYLEDAEYAPED